MRIKAYSMKSSSNERPFYSIKSFCQIYFKNKRLVVPRFQIKGMNDFLSDNNIGRNVPITIKADWRD
jgi:hypothetical protein